MDATTVPPEMAHPLRSVSRAALAGLVLGLLGAAMIFASSAWTHATTDCSFPDTEECNFELTNAQEVSRLQSFAAIGCVLIGGGLYLALRRK